MEETTIRELMIKGITLLGEGATPRAVGEQLVTFLAPKTRKAIDPQAG